MRGRVGRGRFWRGLALTGAALLAATSAGAQWRTPWSYEQGPNGPAHWGDLDPDYIACRTGTAQSPIDITGATKTALPPLRFDFRAGPVRIANNGYTAVRVDYAPGNGDLLTIGGLRYELTQFHFHHPSEEELNGKRSDMNAHFMLKGEDGKLIGVAVFLKAGRANPAVTELWRYMPTEKGPPHDAPGLMLDPGELLPGTLGYYVYTGSVSAPPCAGGVVWYVLKTPVEVSRAQIDAFARLYPHDVRPIQPRNGRVIQERDGG